MRFRAFFVCLAYASFSFAQNETAVRARDLGVPFEGTPGPLNAITDVGGVEVGATTLIHGDGKLKVGEGPVRTGVTAILPRGRQNADPVYAGWFSLNGNGEMTGTTWVEESGFLAGPVALTNTHSVGLVRDSVIAWALKHGRMHEDEWSLPVVAETWDGYLNDINGFHVKQQDVLRRWMGRAARGCRRGTPAAAQEWCATGLKAERGRRRAFCREKTGGIRWAFWCSATAAGGRS